MFFWIRWSGPGSPRAQLGAAKPRLLFEHGGNTGPDPQGWYKKKGPRTSHGPFVVLAVWVFYFSSTIFVESSKPSATIRQK